MYTVEAKNLEIRDREHKVDLHISKDGEKITEKTFTCAFNQFKKKRESLFISVSMMELEYEGLESFADDYNVSDFKSDERVEYIEGFEDPYA